MKKLLLPMLLLLVVLPCMAQTLDLQPLTISQAAVKDDGAAAAKTKIGPITLSDDFEFSAVTATTFEEGVLAGCVSYRVAKTADGQGMFWVDLGAQFDGSSAPDPFLGISTNLHTENVLGVGLRGIFGYLFTEDKWFVGTRLPLSVSF